MAGRVWQKKFLRAQEGAEEARACQTLNTPCQMHEPVHMPTRVQNSWAGAEHTHTHTHTPPLAKKNADACA